MGNTSKNQRNHVIIEGEIKDHKYCAFGHISRSRYMAVLLAIMLILSHFNSYDGLAYAASVVRLDVYANPSYGGTATAKTGESTVTAYYNVGDAPTVSAKANEGYLFVRWRNGSGETLSTAETYSFKISTDMSMTAEFKKSVNVVFSGGSGTSKDPYQIDNAEDLSMVAQYPGMYFKQTSNIDLKDVSAMTSIGKASTLFSGVYDGNGKIIKNLTMNRPDEYNVGLFNIDANGVVKNLKIIDANIKATGTAGILAGINLGKITDCDVEGSVVVTHNNQGAGLLAGENRNLILNCSAKGSVTGKNQIGGLVGLNTSAFESTGRIENSYADATVTSQNCGGGLTGANESGEYSTYPFTGNVQRSAEIVSSFAKGNVGGGWQLGGLIGNNNGSISNCYATGDVTGSADGEIMGGFVAYNGGSIINSYATGHVEGLADTGGFAGINSGGTITQCYYNRITTGKSDTGKGEAKETEAMIEQSTYASWSFTDIWTKQSSTYPYLSWQTANFPIAPVVTGTPVLKVDSVGSHQTALSWSTVDNASAYRLYRGESAGNYSDTYTLDVVNFTTNAAVTFTTGAIQYVVSGLDNNKTYYFAVRAKSDNGDSSYSNEVSAMPHEKVSGTSLTAAFSVIPSGESTVGTAITLDASLSKAADTDTIVLYTWDFGDSVVSQGEQVHHTYAAAGTFTVTLTVTDDKGNKAHTSQELVIKAPNHAPNADAGGPYVLYEHGKCILDASQSSDMDHMSGDAIVQYSWDLNEDGYDEITSTEPTYELTWDNLLHFLPNPEFTDKSTGLPVHHLALSVTDREGTKGNATANLVIYAVGDGGNINEDDKAVQTDTTMLEIATHLAAGDTTNYVTQNFTVPLAGANGTTIAWTENSNYVAIDSATGQVTITRPTTTGWEAATVSATVSKGSVSDGKHFLLYIPKAGSDLTPVIISDVNLKTILLASEINANHDNEISKEEAMATAYIVTNSVNMDSEWIDEPVVIESFEGLEAFENLKGIQIRNVAYKNGGTRFIKLALNDLEPLRNLTHLEVLNMDVAIPSVLGDASAVYALKNLKVLNLTNFGLTEISGIRSLAKLTELYLGSNRIADIEPISDIAGGLTKLVLNDNPINNKDTAGYYHKTEKDFTVDNVAYEVWAIRTVNHTGNSDTNVKKPISENPLLQQSDDSQQLSPQDAAKIDVSKDFVSRSGNRANADLSGLDLTQTLARIAGNAVPRDGGTVTLSPITRGEDKLILNIPADEDIKMLAITLPKLTGAFEQVDRVSIESAVASFEIQKDTFGTLGNDGIKLSAEKLDRESLPANLKAYLPADVESIIDLNAYVNDQKVSNFNVPIEVSVPYILKAGEDPEKVSVYLLNDSGEIEKVAGTYNAATGKITVKRNHFSRYFIRESDDSFSDIQTNWAKQAIEVLAGKGIIGGKGNGMFDPNGIATRAEFAAIVAKVLMLEPVEAHIIFEDINPNSWYAEPVNAMYQAGIVGGVAVHSFAPDQALTREEAAVMLNHTLDYLGTAPLDDSEGKIFSDEDQIADWAKDSVKRISDQKIMNGYPSGEFMPKKFLIRSEMAQLIYQIYFEK
ncbi:MAG: hypothetical protein PWP38_2246 [Clostridiales bacterium]|nr:hypothetical protein [Clostridiales bacterium]